MFTITVYDTDLQRRGRMPATKGAVVLRRNGVATFEVTILDSPAWRRFRDGWHLSIESDGAQLLSGQPDRIVSSSRAGHATITLSGRSHLAWLADTITLPSPTKPADQQSDTAAWTAKGPADRVAHQLITAHLGPTAHPTRRRPIALAAVPGTGAAVSVASRFQPLLDEVRGVLGDGLVLAQWLDESDRQVHVEIRRARDFSRRVRLSQHSGALREWSYERKAPTVTDVLVAGQGQGAARTLKLMSGNRTEWGTSILHFQDRRDTDDATELVKAGSETLKEGQETASMTVKIADGLSKRFGRDFVVGDTVTVELAGGVSVTDIVQTAEVLWAESGRSVELQVGPVAEDLDAPGWVKRVRGIDRKLRRIEAV